MNFSVIQGTLNLKGDVFLVTSSLSRLSRVSDILSGSQLVTVCG